jgi:catechol 2,3-dioxygenase-like lactoylglutathione lyase family enzyme
MNHLKPALKIHIALTVRNVEASVEFYRRLFGIEPAKVRPRYAKFDVQYPPVNLTLNQGEPMSQGVLSHLGIQVAATEDVLAIRRQWQEAGLEPRDEMKTDCCYALQDKSWVRDPDGNEWEVFVVIGDTTTPATGCCSSNATLVSIASNS